MEVKWSGDYLSVVSPENYGYESVHEADMVLCLPVVDGKYIIRKEVCPAYTVKSNQSENEGSENRFWTMVSGTVDEGETPLQTLKREMREETPVLPKRIRVVQSRKEIPFVKLTTQRTSIYYFEVLEYDQTQAQGDGSQVESQSTHKFVTASELQDISNRPNADFTIQYTSALISQNDI